MESMDIDYVASSKKRIPIFKAALHKKNLLAPGLLVSQLFIMTILSNFLVSILIHLL